MNYIKNKTRQLSVSFILMILLFFSSNLIAQTNDIVVSGTVTSLEDGVPLPGVSIILKGTTEGTSADFDGNYSINVPNDGVLLFSYIGFETKEISVNGQLKHDVALDVDAQALDEVVVTALGIKREEKSLGYSVGKVAGEELTRVVNENVLNSLTGKVSGVTINSTGGTGSSVNVVIRGATSLSTDNQPLFVVDGVPITSPANNVGGFGNENRVDYGSAISDLDPESIESISILKGPSAAALYGSRGGNGVVLVTTKKGKENEGMKVSFSTSSVYDIPTRSVNIQKQFSTGFFSFRPEDVGGNILPEITGNDATGAGPENDRGYYAIQWGAPLDANGQRIPTEIVSYPDNFNNFLNDYAITNTYSAAITGSTDIITYRLGLSNTDHEGLIPNSDLHKNNLSLAISSKVSDKLTVSTNINFANSGADNRPASNRGANPLQHAISSPANIDIEQLRDYDDPSASDGVLRISDSFENPYFIAYGINNSFNRYRIYGNLVANYEVSPSFSLMGRYTLNKTDEIQETKIAPGYTQEPNNGAYGIVTSTGSERNFDVLATYTKDLQDFTLTTSVGGNTLKRTRSFISNSSKSGSGLVVPNLFTVQNISSGALDYRNNRSEKVIYSVYALANMGYKDMVYLDVTARNDWSSTLPGSNRSYFYPSASLSVLANELFNMGEKVNMLKLRGGWAQSGNDTDPYNLFNVYNNVGQWGDATRLGVSSGLLTADLKSEKATSIEFGLDLKLFSNRLRFEGTYYTLDNKNQILQLQLPISSGFNSINTNTGLLQSKGWELLLGFTPIRTKNWNWDLNVNFTQNETTIIDLGENIESIEFWDAARVKSIGYEKNLALGRDGKVGNLYARKIKRVTDESSQYFGYPILGSGLDTEWQGEEELSKVGNYNPDFIMGLQTSVSYKNFSLNMSFDWRSGGQYVSQTYRYQTEGVNTQTWLDELVNPGDLGGGPSVELQEWVEANADVLLLGDRLRPIGGPTPEYGGFPESFSGTTVFDGTFAPGVVEELDDDGNFVGYIENLGGEGTTFLPYVVSYPWDIGEANLFDADYIKLREISLNYKASDNFCKTIGMDAVNFSIYSRNIMVWTKDSGFGIDPERAFQAEGNGGFSQGVERYNVNPWVVPIGFKIGFTF